MTALSDILFELENRTLCYIEGDCFKGAVLIALSCDAIVMHRNSKIGYLAPNIQHVDASTAEVIVNDLKKTALKYSRNKYNPSVILAMFGEKSDQLYRLDGSLASVSKDSPAVLSSELAERLNVSRKTVQGMSDVLALLKKE